MIALRICDNQSLASFRGGNETKWILAVSKIDAFGHVVHSPRDARLWNVVHLSIQFV
jgi:hypothetical protein